MAPLTTLALSLACLAAAWASPTVPTRNTITFEETQQGEVFENVDIFNQLRDDDASVYRLPTTTRPSHYSVLWAIDFNSFSFVGTVVIQLQPTQTGVSEIVIHSEDLIITTYSLVQGTTIIPVTLVEEPEYEFLRFQLQNNTLLVFDQTYTLTITFEAPLRNDMYGIYRSWYREGNTTRWMASTQYQATSARKAFPCYDEPSFKAVFDITIRRPTAYRSWSCTRIANTANVIANTQDDIYHPTPYMSTYLIAIIVAEYDALELLNANGSVMYEVIARPSAISEGQGQYAFDVGQELLAEMNDHTGIDFYSVDANLKMTQAAIPDFSAGAMENWGLLTYREAYLLYVSEHTSNYFQQLIAYILSHEIAHMWFGNLVTCDWWDVLWMNEGFARYYQYFLTHWVEDHMGLETRFITEQVHTSLLSDSANNPHPLSNNGIGSPASVSGMFSTLSYNKGAAIIRMTEHLLGFEVHREGLRNYLTTFAHQTVLPIDLFNSLQAVAVSSGAIAEYGTNFNVVDYYRSWTEVAGVPVLNVHVNHQTGDMTIQQRRFNINTGYSSVTNNWIVPLTFSTASNPDFNNTKPTHIISDAVTVINRGSVGDEWVIFNKQQTGYYRVNYDDYTWDLIVIALRGNQRTQIHEYNRAQIVNDVFQFARSGLMSYNRAFNILSFLENETSYAPWVAAVTGFSWIRNRLAGTTSLAPIEAMIQRWATTVMNDLTYTETANEDFMRQYLRWQLAPLMCAMNVAACRASAVQQYAALRTLGTEVPVNSRNWVYCNALRDGTTADFDFLWNRFQEHNVYTEKITILMTIGCTPHQVSLNTFLDGIVQENELVRPQDYTTAFNTAVAGNEGNTQLVFTYIQNNIPAVTAAFGSIALPLSYVSARLRSEQEITAFQTWVTNNAALLSADPNVAVSIANGAENSRQNLLWASAVSSDLNDYITIGDLPIAATTSSPPIITNPVTVGVPDLDEPVAPNLPDSAVTSVVSIFAIFAAVAANLMA